MMMFWGKHQLPKEDIGESGRAEAKERMRETVILCQR